jgi:hypothetical protein
MICFGSVIVMLFVAWVVIGSCENQTTCNLLEVNNVDPVPCNGNASLTCFDVGATYGLVNASSVNDGQTLLYNFAQLPEPQPPATVDCWSNVCRKKLEAQHESGFSPFTMTLWLLLAGCIMFVTLVVCLIRHALAGSFSFITRRCCRPLDPAPTVQPFLFVPGDQNV